MLKIATMVCCEPIPMRLRQVQHKTTSHTELIGVWVYELTLLQKLHRSGGASVKRLSQNLERDLP